MDFNISFQDVIIYGGTIILIIATIYRYAVKKYKFDGKIYLMVIIFCYGSAVALGFSAKIIAFLFFKTTILGFSTSDDLLIPAFVGGIVAAYVTTYCLVKFIINETL